MEAQHQSPVVIRIAQVQALTGLSETLVYTEVAAGRFPRQIRIGQRAVGWLASEVNAWLAARIAERDRHGALVVGAKPATAGGEKESA